MQLSALVRGSAAHNVVVVLDLALRPQNAWEMIECLNASLRTPREFVSRAKGAI